MHGWTALLLAGLLEVVWALGLKHSGGFTRLWPSVGTVSAMLLSFYLLSRALQTLPVGAAYAVWTGIGTLGTAVFAMAFLGEPRDPARLFFIALTQAGIVGLRWVSS